jgi:hypothetical protein
MFLLTVQLEGVGQACVFRFRTREAALKQYQSVQEVMAECTMNTEIRGHLSISDDFGNEAIVLWHGIENVQIIDVARDIEAQVELALMQQRAQQRVENDLLRKFGGFGPVS